MKNSCSKYEAKCPNCFCNYQINAEKPPLFCPLCGQEKEKKSMPEVAELHYEILHLIGKGGMGEVFAAFDPKCKRRIALKRIRPDLIEHPQIRYRFLKEAHITCQLSHPAIIPIYSIVSESDMVFYTMPLIEGKTLKEILRKAKQQEKSGEKIDYGEGSIASLMPIFMTVCQAVAYAHSKQIIHRDLKPENIIIGRYGEVFILDWGLAKWVDQGFDEEELQTQVSQQEIQELYQTRIGKVVGTISYMAPERASGSAATFQTDIYSLGVILYQILTLIAPFKRKSLEEFRRHLKDEVLIDPLAIAPHREIPKMLAQCTLKCLATPCTKRYKTVNELVHDLTSYIEGRSEWFLVASLNTKEKEDWEFQENILIVEHLAITPITEDAEWMGLMISRQSIAGNTKCATTLSLGKQSHGIGLLFNIPEESERSHLNEGYCLWIGSDSHRTTRLLRSNVEIMQVSDVFLKREHFYKIRIEKIDKSVRFYIDDILQFTYLAHLPLLGTHIGLLSRDMDFTIDPLKIYVGSLNLTLNCLAIPDAFLAHRDYPKALSEYRRIAYSFPDRIEGREAQFRAGLTFIEQAKNSQEKLPLLEEALLEFEKLQKTSSAPLQYLGKALVYEILEENEEEVKCFELAYRRYPRHPLLPVLQEHILSRMQEVSRKERQATYRFISLVLRLLPASALNSSTKRILKNLKKHWEPLFFIEGQCDPSLHPSFLYLATPLLFWLNHPLALEELTEKLLSQSPLPVKQLCDAFFCLIELGASQLVEKKLAAALKQSDSSHFLWVKKTLEIFSRPLQEVASLFDLSKEEKNFSALRALYCFLDRALEQEKAELAILLITQINFHELSATNCMLLHYRLIWAYLLKKEWQKAGDIFSLYSIETLSKDQSLLRFLYGCWLCVTEGSEIATIHFMGLLPTTYPRSWTLGIHFLIGHITSTAGWGDQAFIWEKKQLYRQLALYYHCVGDIEKKRLFTTLYSEALHT